MSVFVPPSQSYPAYIFDCDGTLVDTMPIHLRAWNFGLASSGSPLRIDGKGFMSVAGMSVRQTIEHWNRTHDLQIDAEAVIHAKDAYFAEHSKDVQPIPEVVAYAHACHQQGAALAVASGGIRSDVLRALSQVGLLDIFPVIVTAEDVALAKPAPDLFLLAARRLNVQPADCLVIEDSPLGIQAADLAGMDSVLVPHRF